MNLWCGLKGYWNLVIETGIRQKCNKKNWTRFPPSLSCEKTDCGREIQKQRQRKELERQLQCNDGTLKLQRNGGTLKLQRNGGTLKHILHMLIHAFMVDLTEYDCYVDKSTIIWNVLIVRDEIETREWLFRQKCLKVDALKIMNNWQFYDILNNGKKQMSHDTYEHKKEIFQKMYFLVRLWSTGCSGMVGHDWLKVPHASNDWIVRIILVMVRRGDITVCENNTHIVSITIVSSSPN